MGLNVSGQNPGPNQDSSPALVPVQYNPDTQALYSQGARISPTGIPAALLQRIRANLAASAGGQNAAQRAPLLAPPSWAATTAYLSGQVVTNANGNLYVCSVAGTSAASGGPTGQAAATQVDGTASWQYFGPVLTTTSSAIAPAVSFANYTGVGNASYFWANVAQTTSKYAPGSPNFFYLEGGFWQNATQSGGTPGINCYGGIGSSSSGSQIIGGIASNFWGNPCGSVTFYTDAPKFMLGGAVNVGATNPSGGYVEIDDVPLSDSPFYNTTNNGYGLLIDYTGVGGRKARKVRVYCSTFSGVSTFDNISQVWAYAPPDAYKIGWIGDSISAGAAGGPFGTPLGSLNYSAMSRFCRMVGCESLFNQTCGGMGFANAINGYVFQTAAVSLSLYNPDMIIICGNYDDNAVASATRLAAVVSCLTYLRATFPNTTIIGYGPWGSIQNGSAAWIQLEADMQNGFAAMNDPNMFFIPLITRASGVPWVTGTGNIGATANGNSSEYVYTDSTHPTALAHKEYIPRVYVEAFKALIAAQTAQ